MAQNKVYQVEYAGHPVKYAFREPGTAALFRERLTEACGEPDVFETEEFLERAKRLMPDEPPECAEFRSLICLTSKLLLRHGCCLFHAVSFEMDGLAWLLTAPSGTGKSTQYMNWQRQFPREARMISGDVPVIEASDRGVLVHPSPWNGKEGLGNPRLSAPLGGIVILEQGDEDRIETVGTAEAVYRMLPQFIVLLETEDEVRALCAIVDRLLRSVPVRKLVNRGGAESTALLRSELKRLSLERKGTPNE
ncbi:MAG: hypothetical protein IKP26_08135 [Clostridia bacterium]|nr:hypothetical protein [Clostridia bacterium]